MIRDTRIHVVYARGPSSQLVPKQQHRVATGGRRRAPLLVMRINGGDGNGAPSSSEQQQQQQQQQPHGYYAGLITRDLKETNGADASDMLKRSLQLAGGFGGLLLVLLLGFMASNGLL